MRADIAAALAPRQETLQFAGLTLVVREMETAADVAAFQDNIDMTFKLIVRCVFDENGNPAFTDEDIPAMKRASKVKFRPIADAVNRVNGFDIEDSAKNSAAAPA